FKIGHMKAKRFDDTHGRLQRIEMADIMGLLGNAVLSIAALEKKIALGNVEKPRDLTQQARLARPVRPRQHKRCARRDLEGKPFEGKPPAPQAGKVTCDEAEVRCRQSARPCPCRTQNAPPLSAFRRMRAPCAHVRTHWQARGRRADPIAHKPTYGHDGGKAAGNAQSPVRASPLPRAPCLSGRRGWQARSARL